MPIATWPSLIPAASARGYAYREHDGVVRSQVGGGLTAARQRVLAAPWFIDLQWDTSEQYVAIIEAWWSYYGQEGTVWAEGVLIDTGHETAAQLVRFLAEPDRQLVGTNHYRMTATVELDQASRITQAALDALL